MTSLSLKLHQPYAYGRLEVGAIAEAWQVVDAAGALVTSGWRETRSVAVSGGNDEGDSAADFTRFDLPGQGRYEINIRLPRGGDLTREFEVMEGEDRTEVIRLEVSPHEFLGWQQFSGLVRRDPYTKEWAGASDVGPVGTAVQRATVELLSSTRKRQRHLFDERGSVPDVFSVNFAEAAHAWDAAVTGQGSSLSGMAQVDLLEDWGAASEDEFCTWFREMPTSGEAYTLIDWLRNGSAPQPLSDRFPRWILVDRDGHRDLASVPWAWWGGAGRGPGEELRILYDRVRSSPIEADVPGRLILSLQDRRWGGLLEFVASGRMFEAATIAEGVFRRENPVEALYGKLKGPFPAVLGGLVLIAQAADAKEEHWDQWLVNLANWFPQIPDGEALLGYRLLQRGRLDEGREHLRQSIRRGVPFFSATLRLLNLGLAQVEDDESLSAISRTTARVDPTQPFTVLRLPRAAP